VPAWTGPLAEQHVDIRLTAEDGYQAERSYSIASPAGTPTQMELTVERISNGEVSSFLTEQLVAGGSGLVSPISILRTRHNSLMLLRSHVA
jgi:ferredoxin-NADP reductase